MVEIPFLIVEFIYSSIWLISRIIIWVKNKKIDWRRELLLLLIYVNFAVLIRFVFFPMEHIEGKVAPLVFDFDNVFPFRINIIPFVHIAEYDSTRDIILNILGNILMFVPTGIVFPIVYKKLNSFPKVLLAGFLISLLFEIIQLPFSVRVSDIDDLILDTIGVALGYLIYYLIKSSTKRRIKK